MKQGRDSTEAEKRIDDSRNRTDANVRKDQTEIHFVILRETLQEFYINPSCSVIFIAEVTYNCHHLPFCHI